jgi:hypothetical protein
VKIAKSYIEKKYQMKRVKEEGKRRGIKYLNRLGNNHGKN